MVYRCLCFVETTAMHFLRLHVYFKAFFAVYCGTTEECFYQVIILTHLIFLMTNEGTFCFSTIDYLFILSFKQIPIL